MYAKPARVKPNTHRRHRRNSTVELSCVGVGGVYWALRKHEWYPKTNLSCRLMASLCHWNYVAKTY